MSHTRTRKLDTRTETGIRRGKLVTEIETMATAGQLDRLMFVNDAEDAQGEAEVLASNTVAALDPDTIAEYRALARYGVERIERAVGKQRMIRGGREERR